MAIKKTDIKPSNSVQFLSIYVISKCTVLIHTADGTFFTILYFLIKFL